jgi:hypothetical protein
VIYIGSDEKKAPQEQDVVLLELPSVMMMQKHISLNHRQNGMYMNKVCFNEAVTCFFSRKCKNTLPLEESPVLIRETSSMGWDKEMPGQRLVGCADM